jgi:cytochrome c oxidase subunit 1
MPPTDKVEIEMPSPSFWPILVALSLTLMAAGVIFTLILTAIGFIGLLICIGGWTLENRRPHTHVEVDDHE